MYVHTNIHTYIHTYIFEMTICTILILYHCTTRAGFKCPSSDSCIGTVQLNNFCFLTLQFNWTMASSQPVNNKSLLSVQELAKKPRLAIPHRFVQPYHESTVLSDAFSIPIVDMKNLIMGESKELELEKLHSICKTLGIFQVFLQSQTVLITLCEINYPWI